MREGRGTSGAFLPHKSGVYEELRYTQKPDVNVELRGGGARGGGCSEEEKRIGKRDHTRGRVVRGVVRGQKWLDDQPHDLSR